MTGKRILIDTSKCIGCKACQIACQQWHSLTAEDTTFTGSYTNPPELSETNLTLIRFIEKEEGDNVKFLFLTSRCRHCQDPRCKEACPLGAIKKQKNGIVRIDPDICDPTACSTDPLWVDRPCQRQCPFKDFGGGTGIPRRQYVKNGTPISGKSYKCDFCYDRFGKAQLKSGKFVGAFAKSNRPACEVTCGPGAIKSGAANTMMNKATKRVKYLKNHGYPDANVYPNDFPTHVIWVLTEKPEVYGLSSV
jgi:formate dehydrogenase iron-sulfur subunit